jgi:uncharacterized repeat protein (TIGR01451 family)
MRRKLVFIITMLTVLTMISIMAPIVALAQNNLEETDISVIKSDDVDPVAPGEEIIYTIVVNNNGPDVAGEITVVDTLPFGVTGISAGVTLGVVGFILAGTAVQWDLPSGLVAGGSATATIRVRVNPDTTGVITNTVEATTEHDPDPFNNSASEETTINQAFIEHDFFENTQAYITLDIGLRT